MKTNLTPPIRRLLVSATLAFATVVFGADATTTETMCVKQKDGSYLCKASGRKEAQPCCSTPDNETKSKAKQKRRHKTAPSS